MKANERQNTDQEKNGPHPTAPSSRFASTMSAEIQSRSNSPASATTRPLGAMIEEIPVLAPRTTQRLLSTARSTAI